MTHTPRPLRMAVDRATEYCTWCETTGTPASAISMSLSVSKLVSQCADLACGAQLVEPRAASI